MVFKAHLVLRCVFAEVCEVKAPEMDDDVYDFPLAFRRPDGRPGGLFSAFLGETEIIQ